MSAYEPDKLLSLWRHEQVSQEMITGHVLQNLVLHDQAVKRLTQMIDTLHAQVDSLLEQMKTLPTVSDAKRTRADRA